jgi:cytochrome c-type biogenesis protein CcmH/NrfG
LLSRLEAQRDKAAAAVKAYREARRLNPDSPLFN